MATTSPDNLRTPDFGDSYNLVPDLQTLANDVQAALTSRDGAAVGRGTAAQRATALAGSLPGRLWQDTDGIRMLWKRGTSAWEPAVWRWSGTTAQMNAFTQAPEGFEWHDSTVNKGYIRVGGAWRPRVNVVQATTITYSSASSTSFQATALSASITPASTSSKVLVTASFVMGTQAAGGNGLATIFRGGIGGVNLGPANGMAQAWAGASTFRSALVINFLDSPASTSSQSYLLAMKSAQGVVEFSPAGTLATMVLQEIR